MSGDPRFEGMSDEQIKAALAARCSMCKDSVVESPAVAGTLLLSMYVPSIGIRERIFLCGDCALSARQFLIPELRDDPVYQAAKGALNKIHDQRRGQ